MTEDGPLSLLIADDLTGAVDSTAPAVGKEWTVRLAAEADTATLRNSDTDQIAVNTDSRHCSAEEAARRVRSVLDSLGGRTPRLIYKKTDSVLRGNIPAELKALGLQWPGLPVFYVPAMPETDRTVRDGILSVDGIPVADTVFACDPESPVRQSSVPDMLRPAFGDALHSVPLDVVRRGDFPEAPGPGCFVFDAETQADLERIAQWMEGRPGPLLMAGPGGFARFLPQIAGRCSQRNNLAWSPPNLVVSGSLHPHSLAQIDNARADGATEVIVTVGPDGAPEALPWPSITETLQSARRLVVHTGPRRKLEPHAHRALDRALAETAARVIREATFADCLVFGGKTATGLVKALGLKTAEVLGSPHPGMGVLRFEVADSGGRIFHLSTKSGGMGPENLFRPDL